MICFALLKTVLLHIRNYYFPSSYVTVAIKIVIYIHTIKQSLQKFVQEDSIFKTSHFSSLLFVQLSYKIFSILYIVRVLNDQGHINTTFFLNTSYSKMDNISSKNIIPTIIMWEAQQRTF